MNIFWLDNDLTTLAQQHIDKHIVKMPLETCQLLSTAWHTLSPESITRDWHTTIVGNKTHGTVSAHEAPFLNGLRIYEKTHFNHPCAVWARHSTANYKKLHALGIALCKEYTYRYERKHLCEDVLLALASIPPNNNKELTTPPLCMPDHCKVNDVLESYRRYYRMYKNHIAVWTKREQPDWWY